MAQHRASWLSIFTLAVIGFGAPFHLTLDDTVAGLRNGIIGTASAATAAVTLDNVRLDFGEAIVTIPHMTATGSPLSAAGLADLFDPSESAGLEDRLAKLTADTLTAPEITVIHHPGGNQEGMRIVLHDVTLRNVVAGRIGSFSLHDIISSQAPGANGKSLKTAAISASRIDLPLALKIATGSRSDEGLPVQSIVEAFSIEAIDLKSDDVEVKAGSMRSGAMRGRPPLISLSQLQALTNKAAINRSESERHDIAKATFDTVESFAADHVEFRDVALMVSGADLTSLDLGAFIVDGVEPGKVALVAAEGFTLRSKAADATFDRLALDGYDQTRLIDAMKQHDFAMDADTVRVQFSQMMPTLAGLSLRAMKVDAAAENLDGNAHQGTRTVFEVPAVDLKLVTTDDGAGTSAAHARIIYDIAADTVDPGLLIFVEAGIPHLDVSMDYALGWNTSTRRATIDTLSIAADKLASVSVGGTFGHLAAALFDSAHTDAASAAAQDIEVEELHLNLGDAGLAAKAWAWAASKAGISVPLLKAEAKGQVQVALLKAFGNTPTATKLSKALSTFIDEPKTLTLAVKAPAGLNIGAIGRSGGSRDLLDLLQIEAKANQ